MRTTLLIIALLTTLLLAACGGTAATEPAASAAAGPAIALDATALDLGDVPNGEVVEREVAVRNTGDAPLAVEFVTTSCGCTTATLDPMTIAPGGTGTLRIAFDSGAHGPDVRGPLMRKVTLFSNDARQPEANLELSANIVAP